MQINGYSGNLPPSTQVINKYGPTSPEQVNKVVDAASDRVDERQESRELEQAAKRDAATQIYSANTQQRQIETYLAVASEGEVESQPTPLETPRSCARRKSGTTGPRTSQISPAAPSGLRTSRPGRSPTLQPMPEPSGGQA